MKILVANIGSTSFKHRVFQMPGERILAEGRIERIGRPGGFCPDYPSAIARSLDAIVGPGRALSSLAELSAVGFKAVHAGPISGTRLVDDEVLAALEAFAFLAPAHNPPYVAAMRAFREQLPDTPLVAAFETAFFEGLDEAATTYAVPYSWSRELGVRRYGFHGASHRAASERAQGLVGRRDLRHVSCHLGGSSSLAAIRNGAAIDTSFGASPQSGLPQNDRVGDLDAFALLYVMKRCALGVDEMAAALSRRSGLAGISGSSGDVRDLLAASRSGDARARLALDVFVRAVRRHLGAFLVEMGGLDVLSFSGGIGENSPEIRSAVCAGLEELGIALDPKRNLEGLSDQSLDREGYPVKIFLIHSDEERIIARLVAACLAAPAQPLRP
jgi:acetate kinase